MRGFDFLIAVIGLFGIGEILLSMEEGLSFSGKTAKINPKIVFETWAKLPKYWMVSLRSCLIGIWMGITPGGATPASFMSYGVAKRISRSGDKFGTDFVWGLIASMYLGNLFGLLIVLTCVPLFAAILRIPFSIIAPVILVICAIGAYSVHSAMLDIWFMMLFGVVGYLFKKLNYPLAPLVLALVLGDRAEDSFRQSMLIAQGDVRIFFSNGLVGGITGLALILLFWPLIAKVLPRRAPA
jgi:putative tricarboxylic transport membrane protein